MKNPGILPGKIHVTYPPTMLPVITGTRYRASLLLSRSSERLDRCQREPAEEERQSYEYTLYILVPSWYVLINK